MSDINAKRPRRRRRGDDEIVAIMREAEGMDTPAVLAKWGVTYTTWWRWRRKHPELCSEGPGRQPRNEAATIVFPPAAVADVRTLRVCQAPEPSKRQTKAWLRGQIALRNQEIRRLLGEVAALRIRAARTGAPASAQ